MKRNFLYQITAASRLEGYRSQIPVLSVLYPQVNLLNHPPPPEKNSWVRHCQYAPYMCVCLVAMAVRGNGYSARYMDETEIILIKPFKNYVN